MSNDRNANEMAAEYDFSGAQRGRYAGRFYVDPDTPVGTHVVLRRPLAEHRLQQGDVGQIVRVSEGSIEVDFVVGAGDDSVRVMLDPGVLRLLRRSEVLHVRETRAG